MHIAIIIISFIVALLVIILIHELAHFVTSKRAGVQIEEFGIGLPPRLYGIKRGETIYSINAIPIGAFVKSVGEDDPTVQRSLASRGPWTRLWIYAAGPLANILLGFILVSVFLSLPTSTLVGNGAMVHSVSENSPAEDAGIRPGNIILEVNSQAIHTWQDMQNIINSSKEGEAITLLFQRGESQVNTSLEPRFNPELNRRTIGISLCWNAVSQVDKNSTYYEVGIRPGDTLLSINGHPIYNKDSIVQVLGSIDEGEEVNLVLLRGQEKISASMIRESDSFQALDGIGFNWVDEAHIEQKQVPVWKAIYLGGKFVVGMPFMIIDAIPLIKEDPRLALVGPIGAGQLTVEAVRAFGFSNMLFMASFLSLAIGLFNFLPIPPLDGGGMLVALIEGCRRGKRLSQRAVKWTYTIGTALLISLMVVITFSDIYRLISGEGFGL